MSFRKFNFALKGKFVGYMLTFGLNDKLVGKRFYQVTISTA